MSDNQDTVTDDQRRDWAAQRIEDYVTTVLAAAPPLTRAQVDHLRVLLEPMRRELAAGPPDVGGAA
jgi:hypothetical protein